MEIDLNDRQSDKASYSTYKSNGASVTKFFKTEGEPWPAYGLEPTYGPTSPSYSHVQWSTFETNLP